MISETDLMKLAREVAIGLQEVDQIIPRFGLTMSQWEGLKNHPRFQQLLASFTQEWEGPLNAHERIKLKTSALLEIWLDEAYVRAHDPDESLNAKVELMKFMGRLAGMEGKGDVAVGEGNRFSLTINIGEGQTMKIVPSAPQQLEAS